MTEEASPVGRPHDPFVRSWPLESFLELAALDDATPSARRHVRDVLEKWDLPALVDDAELLASELVTNATAILATAGKPFIELRIASDGERVAIFVWDGNSQLPSVPELDGDVPRLDAEGGRGLFLVETLSQSWGCYPTRDPEGKVTWCQLQTAASLPSR